MDQEARMTRNNTQSGRVNRGEITIDRHYIDEIKTYEVSEDQLTIVESGSSGGTALNFCIALYSILISFIVSLVTTKIEDPAVLTFFWVVISVTLILGTYFLVTWLKAHKSSKSIFVKIRSQKSIRVIRDNAQSEAPVEDISNEQSSDES